jgi:hypothetical protein
VAGGACRAVVGRHAAVNRHYQKKDAQQQYVSDQDAQMQQQQAPQSQYSPQPQNASLPQYAPPAPAPAAGNDVPVQLQQLAQLHASGVVTDEEFAAAKQKALAGR